MKRKVILSGRRPQGGKSSDSIIDISGYTKKMTDKNAVDFLDDLFSRYPALEAVRGEVAAAFEMLRVNFENGGKAIIGGNGGSAADAEHIVGELMKGFVRKRPLPEALKDRLISMDPKKGVALASSLQLGLPAIALTSHPALATAFLNDVNGEMAYAQQLLALGEPGDVFWAISTSGNARNLEYAMLAAKAMGMQVLGLTGKDGGVMKKYADVCIVAPAMETYQIQEMHLPIYHTLCLMLESVFFD